MTNNGKLSKVMLLAGALIFASFHSFPVRAEDNGVTLGEVVSTAVGAYPDIIDVTTASGRLQEEQYKNKKAYEEAQKKYYAALAEAQKEVQEEKAKCDRDPNDCQAYDAARRNLQALQSDDNEMKKAVDAAREKVQETSDQIKKQTREAEDAVYEARKDENKNLKNAEKDIEKYCGDGKNADATKCADARQRKANAERALQQIDVSENAVSGQSLLTQQAINERDQQYNENEEKMKRRNKSWKFITKASSRPKEKKVCWVVLKVMPSWRQTWLKNKMTMPPQKKDTPKRLKNWPRPTPLAPKAMQMPVRKKLPKNRLWPMPEPRLMRLT